MFLVDPLLDILDDDAPVPDDDDQLAGRDDMELLAAAAERMRWLRAVRRRQAEVRAVFEPELERIKALMADALAPLEKREAGIADSLAAVHRAILELDRERGVKRPRKTVITPHGTLKAVERTTWHWPEDDSAADDLCTWLIAHGHDDLVITKQRPDKTAAKGHFTPTPMGVPVDADGEALPGVTVSRSTTYSATTADQL